jgi:hypothetical protein
VYQRTWYDPLIDPPEPERQPVIHDQPPQPPRESFLTAARRLLGHALIRLGVLITPLPRDIRRRPYGHRWSPN